ncbi:MAG: AraC family transcriptional regulator [Bacteroidales bacterium]|jgi:AraC-like DNA-binding protein|nr:AraC family transcriptional regulator [Bacteroidales bacterium]
MNNIPVRNIQEYAMSGVTLRRILNDSQTSSLNHLHRDSYYLFILHEKGENRIVIDFREYAVRGAAVACILPGQAHYGTIGRGELSGWALAMDAALVKNEWKDVFDRLWLFGNIAVPDGETMSDLQTCVALLNRKMRTGDPERRQDIVIPLATSLVGMFAEIYRNRQPVTVGKPPEAITRRFKSLLREHLPERKKPSQYAELLHLSPSYLNEAVKNATGFTAGYWIRHEIILEAKRLLFHTDMSVKEIAFKLGYEDCAYFTRLFTGMSGMSPVQFRKNYRK